MMLYRLLRGIATLALRWYYRSIEVVGIEHVPPTGPVLLVANHWNALVDALVVACALDRRVRLTAKATLLENPFTRVVVRAVGIIPLRRASDEKRVGNAPIDESRNAGAFSAILAAFAHDQVVLIFPEGRSHSELELGRLRTGAARLAIMARDEGGLSSLPIVPVGLTFEDKGRPRSRVVVRVGTPLFASAATTADFDEAHALTARLDRAIRELTLNFASRDDGVRIVELASLLSGILDRVRPLTAPDPPLLESVRLAQRLEAARQVVSSVSPALQLEINAFLDRVWAFGARLRDHEIPVNDLWMPVTALSGTWFVVRELSLSLFAIPITLWGRINHWIPLRVARWMGRATSKNPDEPAMRTLVSGLVLVVAFYLALAAIVARTAGLGWAVLYLAALPPSASLDFWMSDRHHRALARARAYLTLRRNPALRAALRLEASDIRASARQLDERVR